MVQWRKALPLMVCTFLMPAVAAGEEPRAGEVLWVLGRVQLIGSDGAVRPLRKGDVVREGDTIRTGPEAHTQLLMNDDAYLAVRPDSDVKLTTYRYKGQADGSENALIELAKGGLRSITGAIGLKNKKSYRLQTPTQIIGVRGTDHEAHFLAGAGTYDRVTLGGTYIEGASGRIDLDVGETGFASIDSGVLPAKLDRTPDFLLRVAAAQPAQISGPGFRAAPLQDAQRLERSQAGAPALAAGGGLGHGASNAAPGLSPSGKATSATGGSNGGGLGEGGGWGAGGRCGGPCADPAGKVNPGKGLGKGHK